MVKSFAQLKRNLKQDTSSLPVLRVALLGDTATQLLAIAIKGEGVDRGFRVEMFEADYNQVERQILDPESELYGFRASYTIIFQSSHALLEIYGQLSVSDRETLALRRLDFLRKACASIPGRIICYNYPELNDAVFGSYANKVSSSFIYQLRKLNVGLMELAQEFPNLFICDIADIQAKWGRDVFFDAGIYVTSEMVLGLDILPVVAARTLDVICAAEGRVKKCLILDLDNTLWGGVVGDDGWEHIQIGHGLGIGKAFTGFQQWIKKLKERGIILCVCSKNDEEKAKEPFEKNPEMVLKLDDIAVFVANWENKADNIRHIQSILNIGFDAMVFLDDSPFERNLVKENIPGITVPDLPEDPGDYLEYLYSLNLFETASSAAGDKDRTKQYQVEAQRASSAKAFTNEADFLQSLEMRSAVRSFDAFNTPRVAQLSQRSNQFNLRTIRYTEADIAKWASDPGAICLSFTLEDRFGDNGLVAVVIMKEQDSQTLFVDTWFMSCRVLKRGMEDFTLNIMVERAKMAGYRRIVGEYLPTAKNEMVRDHYQKLGFLPCTEDVSARYELDVEAYQPRTTFISKE